MNPKPLYLAQSILPTYKLYWSLSIFWRNSALSADHWIAKLKPLTEKDGVRILEYHQKDNRVSQFLLSTRPEISPSDIIRSVKGRLQHQIRDIIPKAFKKNYSIKSVGSAKHKVVQNYLDSQLDHHIMADPKVQATLASYQKDNPQVDLTKIKSSAHGLFMYNLHLVFVHTERYRETRDEYLTKTLDAIVRNSKNKKHLLSKARLLTDHIHLTVGCDIKESPMEIALSYMNNIAYVHGQVPLLQNSFYAGTFGEYDLGAIRLGFRENR